MKHPKNPIQPPPDGEDEPSTLGGLPPEALAAEPAPPPAPPRKPNASFPIPPEWAPDYQPSHLRASALKIPRDVVPPINVEMHVHWTGKDDKNYDASVDHAYIPVQRMGPPTQDGRAIIDRTNDGTTVERSDLVAMWVPKQLHEKRVRMQDQELREQARGLQSSYEEAQEHQGGHVVGSLLDARSVSPNTPRAADGTSRPAADGHPAHLPDPRR